MSAIVPSPIFSPRDPQMHIASKALLTFPPRPLTDWEQETLRGWVEAIDGFTAFVAERRSDDPAIYRRIVITRRRTRQHAYTIHAPQGMDVWIVVSATESEDIGSFPTLRAALEFVQPCLSGR
jgi:hypothetical protein